MHYIAVVSGTVESFHKRCKKSKRETRIASCSQVRHTHRKQSRLFKNRPWKSAVFTSRAISDGHGACTLENNMQHEYCGSESREAVQPIRKQEQLSIIVQAGRAVNQKAGAVVNHRTGRQSSQSESRSSWQAVGSCNRKAGAYSGCRANETKQETLASINLVRHR